MTARQTLFADGRLILVHGAVARLQLNQPDKRNAISQAMWKGFELACDEIESDPDIKVVVVASADGTAFSAGADISEFAEIYGSPERTQEANRAIRAAQARLRGLDRPTIAMIEGVCVGGGMGIALACDLRFAVPEARFAITPAKLGLAYSFLDTAQLVEKVGPSAAKDILFSARMIEGEEARAIGLVDRLVAADGIRSETMAYAEALTRLSQASIRTAKAVVNGISDALAAKAEAFEARVDSAFSGDDFKEGYSAFLEKRPPVFR
jgi:enoyl-CoA hydratase/carnithine racemase